jgi:hypothetical protein
MGSLCPRLHGVLISTRSNLEPEEKFQDVQEIHTTTRAAIAN